MDNIFLGLPPRMVERANTRLEIRRDESENKQSKKDRGDAGDAGAIEWEDTAYVSIASLRAFLEGLISSEGALGPAPPPVHEASTTINARAANAYQSTARAVHDTNIVAPVAPPPTNAVEADFSEDEIARVRGYIGDLVELSRGGITELALEKKANFLDAIGAAIDTARGV